MQYFIVESRIVIVEDHRLVAEGLSSMLSSREDLEVVAILKSVAEARQWFQSNTADLVLSDYQLPDNTGLFLWNLLKREGHKAGFIMVSMYDDPHIVKEVVESGVKGYLLKSVSRAELFLAINKVLKGEKHISTDILDILIKSHGSGNSSSQLTPREEEVVRLIAKQQSSREIASQLFISENTVENHRKNIMRKTGAKNLAGLVKYAIENGLA